MTKRIQDTQSEKVVAEFLDAHFYPHYFSKYERILDKEKQLLGIDTIVYKNDIAQIIDEKSAIHYVNKNLPTFAFELNFKLSNGEIVEGWFFDEKKKTDLYLLSWITASKTTYFNMEDILNLEIMLIDRKRLIDALSHLGYNKDRVYSVARTIRENNTSGVSYKDDARPCYFYLTQHLSENPMNLVIKKRFLSEHALLHKNLRKSTI